MCESDPPLSEPMCVQVCRVDALTYLEREEEGEEEVKREELEIGLESLADEYGLDRIVDTVARMSHFAIKEGNHMARPGKAMISPIAIRSRIIKGIAAQ